MSNGSILIVDDSSKSLLRLSTVLVDDGYAVRTAENGKLGIAIAIADPPDLILLDIKMPEMDGFDVCRQLKIHAETRNVPVVFLSESTAIADRIEGLRLGAVDFLTAPFRMEELLARVKTHVVQGRIRAQLEQSVVDRDVRLRLATEAIEVPLNRAVADRDWKLVLRLFEPTAFVSILMDEKVRRWVLRLPVAALEAEPGLSFWRAYVLVAVGRVNAAEVIAGRADRKCDDPANANLRGRMKSIRAKAAELRGDGQTAINFATEGVKCAPADTDDYPLASLWLGTANCMAGHPRKSESTFHTGCLMVEDLTGSRQWLTPLCYSWLGRSLYLQGRLNEAYAVSRQAFSVERQYGGPTIAPTYVLEAEVNLSRNLLDDARRSVEKALDLRGLLGQWFALPYSWLTAASVLYACCDPAAGDPIVDALVEWARRNDASHIRDRAESIRANYWVRDGQIERAWLWSVERGLSDDGEIEYSRESILLTLARIYLHRFESIGDATLIDRSLRLVRRLREAAAIDGRMGDHLSAQLVEALVVEQAGKVDEAMEILERCLAFAIPENAFRAFLDEGPPMQRLLETAAARGLLPETTIGLSTMFEQPCGGTVGIRPSSVKPNAANRTSSGRRAPELDNPLTDREFELLELLAAGLTNTEMAQALFISDNTIKTHVRHLFQKLGVSSRTAAVASARSLGLLN